MTKMNFKVIQIKTEVLMRDWYSLPLINILWKYKRVENKFTVANKHFAIKTCFKTRTPSCQVNYPKYCFFFSHLSLFLFWVWKQIIYRSTKGLLLSWKFLDWRWENNRQSNLENTLHLHIILDKNAKYPYSYPFKVIAIINQTAKHPKVTGLDRHHSAKTVKLFIGMTSQLGSHSGW